MLPFAILGCLYFLVKTFIIVCKYIQKKFKYPIRGKIINLKSAKNKFDGQKSYKEYIYEFLPSNDKEPFDFVEITPTKKKSKLSVGMILDIYYDTKLKRYHSLQQIKHELFENIIGFIILTIIIIVILAIVLYVLYW